MSRRALRVFAACAAGALGCASPALPWLSDTPEPPAAVPETWLTVEVARGFAGQPAAAPAGPERVEVLMDVTTSMRAATAPGPGRYAAARESALRLVKVLPPNTFIGLHVLGVAGGSECNPAFRTGHSGPGEERGELLEHIEELAPAGEASLAGAVEDLRVYLGATRTLARSRIVILSDLGDECGGDLCEQLARLVAGGGTVELVIFGDARIPACLEDFRIEGAWRVVADAPAIGFRVETIDATAAGAPPAEGRVGGPPIAVAPGAVRLTVGFDPPAVFGPVELAPGTTTRLRILDFPALEPPLREWAWETDGVVARSEEGREAVDAP